MKTHTYPTLIGAVDIGGTSVRTAIATPLGYILVKDRFPSRPASAFWVESRLESSWAHHQD